MAGNLNTKENQNLVMRQNDLVLMTWSHLFLDLRNRDFYLILGPGQRSLTAGGKKEPILDGYFHENTCLCMLNARNKVQN